MILCENERLDDLHRNGLKIIQNTTMFCFGQDAVLLSAFAKAKRGEKALDLCTGNGVIPILMSAKNNCSSYEGLELLPESANLAKRSVVLNNLQGQINITAGDLKHADKIYAPAFFDVITVNPPYTPCGAGKKNESSLLTAARHETQCTLNDVIFMSAKLLKFGGRFYMIHRPGRLADIFLNMKQYKIEPKKMRLVCPKRGKEPVMVLIEGVKGANPFIKILPELIVYNNNGEYTDEVKNIYYG